MNGFIYILSAFTIWLFSVSFCSAKIIYVPDNYSTIQAAITGAGEGDTIFVGPGEYVENISIISKNVAIIGVEGPEVTGLRPAYSTGSVIRIVNCQGVGLEFSGFSVTGGGYVNTVVIANSSPLITNNIFHNNIPPTGSDQFVMECIESNAVITRNLFYDNGGSYCIAANSGNAELTNNTFDGNGGGLRVLSLDSMIIRNNIISNSTGYGINGIDNDFDYNCLWINHPDYGVYLSPGPHDISADPLYINRSSHDYTLHLNSPCVDAGDPDPIYNDPDGSRSDLGAYWFIIVYPVVYDINYGPDAILNHVSTLTPEIFWSYKDTAGLEQTAYEMEIGIDDDWTEAEMWATGQEVSSDTSVLYSGLTLAETERYYVRIRVRNDLGWGDWRSSTFITRLPLRIDIPFDYPTIQQGIDFAFHDDTVLVAPGIYIENITLSGKKIKLIGRDGPNVTTITPDLLNINTIKIIHGEEPGTEISGFTIAGGVNTHTVIIDSAAAPYIHRNVFRDNFPTDGEGGAVVLCLNSTAEITHNLFVNNGGYGCIGVFHDNPRIINNTFDNNARGFYTVYKLGIAKNNIVSNSRQYGIMGNFPILDYNDVWNNYINYRNANPGLHDIIANPLYTWPSVLGYTLKPESPCIDAGDPSTIYNDPDGTRNDMGASPLMPPYPLAINIQYDFDTLAGFPQNTSPLISWSIMDTAGTIPFKHEIEVGIDQDWTASEMWSSGQVMLLDTVVLYGGSELTEVTTYFLRIRVNNGLNWGEWNYSHFTTPHLCKIINVPSDESSIQAALDRAYDGDTILVTAGEYTENLDYEGKAVIILSQEGSAQTHLKPADPGLPTITMSNIPVAGAEFRGFTICGGGNAYTLHMINVSSPIISQNILHDNLPPTSTAKSVLECGQSSPVIDHNLFYNNGGKCCLNIWSSSAEITNNTFDLNVAGIHLDKYTSCIIRNNIITNCDMCGIFGQDQVIDYNDVWNNGTDYCNQAVPGSNDVSEDPRYLESNRYDYNLHPESPCIDGGDPDSIYNDPDGSRNDMGAIPDTISYPVAVLLNYGPEAIGDTATALTPRIFWSYVDRESFTQVSYEIEIGTDEDWSYAEMWASGPAMSSDTSALYSGTALENLSKYYLRIRLFNGITWGRWRYYTFWTHAPTGIDVPGFCATIQAAIELALSGDKIIVAPGIYKENIDYSGKSIQILAPGGMLVTELRPANANKPTVVITGGENNITEFSGFTVTGGRSSHTILIDSGACPLISQNRFYNNIGYTSANISVISCNKSNPIIADNVFYKNGGKSCIGIYSGTAEIINNTLDTNICGISSDSGQGIVKNNIISRSDQYGIYGSFAIIDYNNFWQNGTDIDLYNTPIVRNNLAVDPVFTAPDEHDYTLQPDSPCRDSGDPDSTYNDPDDTRSDLGAWLPGIFPERYVMSQNYPNPFNARTTIEFELPLRGNVDISIYNILGRKVRTLVNRYFMSGSYHTSWNGKLDSGLPAASGIYFYRITTRDFAGTKKMLLLK